MSKTKAGGSTKLGRDSQSKRLGVKVFGGQLVKAGQVIVRQRGTKFEAGINAGVGVDHTIFATKNGVVTFIKKPKQHFSGVRKLKTFVSVDSK